MIFQIFFRKLVMQLLHKPPEYFQESTIYFFGACMVRQTYCIKYRGVLCKNSFGLAPRPKLEIPSLSSCAHESRGETGTFFDGLNTATRSQYFSLKLEVLSATDQIWVCTFRAPNFLSEY